MNHNFLKAYGHGFDIKEGGVRRFYHTFKSEFVLPKADNFFLKLRRKLVASSGNGTVAASETFNIRAFKNSAVLNIGYIIGAFFKVSNYVGGKENASASVFNKLSEYADKLVPGNRVKPACRLVKNKQLCAVRKRQRQ